MKLVILESPNKTAKVQHYLGAGYTVLATAGHFRDLPDNQLGVDLATFAPTYTVYANKRTLVAKLRAAAKTASEVLLATDADREGEAISWHLAQELRLKRPMRLRYTEITEKGLKAALAAISPLDQNLVDAQQARRILDRLVGYQVSPQMRVLGDNHSAGRVQSATLHLVVARELEREAFKPQDYWTVTALYTNALKAKHVTVAGDGSCTDTRFTSSAAAEAAAATGRVAPHVVKSVTTAPKERRPHPPFTTSTVQQAASSKLGLKPDQTMKLLQELFEAGEITYHRTDSVALSEDAVHMARAFIAKDYPAALPAKPPAYKSKANAQGAHEAIRPTTLDPEKEPSASGQKGALYDLIRRRFLACQSKPALLSETTVLITAATTTWRAVGAIVQFDGFLHYLDDDESTDRDDEEDAPGRLPAVTMGQPLPAKEITVAAKQTKPPPRFNEASLIKMMEATGIGRPSTYAGTIATLFKRDYVATEKKQLYPTERGRLVDAVLGKAYPELLETTTTADLEKHLDDVADGKRRWTEEIRQWYGPFAAKLAAGAAIFAREAAARPALAASLPAPPKTTGKPCPSCGKELLLRTAKKGGTEFLACSGFPACSYTANASAQTTDRACPHCQRPLVLIPGRDGNSPFLSCTGYSIKDEKGHRACSYSADAAVAASALACPICSGPMEELPGKHGRYARCLKASCKGTIDTSPKVEIPCPRCGAALRDKGAFLGCSRYPACRGTFDREAIGAAQKADHKCPQCKKLLVPRKGPRGPFLGCSGYPECSYATSVNGPRPRDPAATP